MILQGKIVFYENLFDIKPKPEFLRILYNDLNDSPLKQFYIDNRFTIESCHIKDLCSDKLDYDNINIKEDFSFEVNIIGQESIMIDSPLQKLLERKLEKLSMWRMINSYEEEKLIDRLGIFYFEVYKIEM